MNEKFNLINFQLNKFSKHSETTFSQLDINKKNLLEVYLTNFTND